MQVLESQNLSSASPLIQRSTNSKKQALRLRKQADLAPIDNNNSEEESNLPDLPSIEREACHADQVCATLSFPIFPLSEDSFEPIAAAYPTLLSKPSTDDAILNSEAALMQPNPTAGCTIEDLAEASQTELLLKSQEAQSASIIPLGFQHS
jgi:hypothetical protein